MLLKVAKHGKLEFVQGTLPKPTEGSVNCMFAVQPGPRSASYLDSRGKLRLFESRGGDLYKNLVEAALEVIRKSNDRLFGPFDCTSNGKTVHGLHYLVPYLPGDKRVGAELDRCAETARTLGIPLLGLGGLLSAGGRGIRLAKRYEKGEKQLGVVAGGSGTAYALVLGILEGARRLRLTVTKSTLVIIGVGEVAMKTLLLLLLEEKSSNEELKLGPRACRKSFKKIILVNPSSKNLDTIKHRLEHELGIRGDRVEYLATIDPVTKKADARIINAAIAQGDVILFSTSASTPGEIGVDPTMIKKGSLVIDAGRPHSLDMKQVGDAPPYLLTDGAILKTRCRIHDQSYEFIGTGEPFNALGCFSELLDCALRGSTSSPELTSRFSMLTVQSTSLSMQENAFDLAPLRCFDQPLDYREFGRIKRLRRKIVVRLAVERLLHSLRPGVNLYPRHT